MASKHAARQGRRLLAGRRGFAALGSGLAAAAGGVMALLPHHPGTARPVASNCGLVTCTAAIPSPVVASITAGPSPSPRQPRKPARTRHRPRPHPRPSHTQPAPATPAAPATQPAAPPPTITVTYVAAARRGAGVQGQFTITNHGSSYLSGWQLTATLPGDRFMSAWGSAYQVSGNTITFSQALLQGGIGPGSSLTLGFDASGAAASPASCSFDGSACVP